MARILILAKSGFGKSTSIGNIPELEIQGLNPEETYVISATSKPLPFRNSATLFPSITPVDGKTLPNLGNGMRRLISNNPAIITLALEELLKSPMKYIVIDDFNYIMQDYYMDNALSKGWDAPKKIGFDVNKIFKAIEKYQDSGKHIIVLAHGEDVVQPDGRTYVKMKTTGKMVDEYITPEGKFDITLTGISRYDTAEKKVKREFLTNENEQYASAKSPYGMFETDLIPNDLGYVVQKINEYYN